VRKNVGVQVCALNFSAVWKIINGARGVHSIGRAQRNLVGVRAMWCMLSHDNLVNGVQWGILKFGMVQRIK
jgi:hypothetical protein